MKTEGDGEGRVKLFWPTLFRDAVFPAAKDRDCSARNITLWLPHPCKVSIGFPGRYANLSIAKMTE